MLAYTFFKSEEDKVSLSWRPYPEGVVLIVRTDEEKPYGNEISVPLDFRALTLLKAEVESQLQDFYPETPEW